MHQRRLRLRIHLQVVLSRLCYLSCTNHRWLLVADRLLLKGQLLRYWPHAWDQLAALARRGLMKTWFSSSSLLSHRRIQALSDITRLVLRFRAILPVRLCAELLTAMEEHAASIVRIYCLRDADLLG